MSARAVASRQLRGPLDRLDGPEGVEGNGRFGKRHAVQQPARRGTSYGVIEPSSRRTATAVHSPSVQRAYGEGCNIMAGASSLSGSRACAAANVAGSPFCTDCSAHGRRCSATINSASRCDSASSYSARSRSVLTPHPLAAHQRSNQRHEGRAARRSAQCGDLRARRGSRRGAFD
jgi:hypothetical protein